MVFRDIEPVTDATLTPGLDSMLEFARVLHEQTGEKIALLQADIIWLNRWQPQLVEWRTRLHAAGMKFGVIVDGDPADRPDSEWAAHAISRYRLVMSNPRRYRMRSYSKVGRSSRAASSRITSQERLPISSCRAWRGKQREPIAAELDDGHNLLRRTSHP